MSPFPLAWGGFDVTVVAWIQDVTNNSTTYGSAGYLGHNAEAYVAGNWTFHGKNQTVASVSAVLVPGHTYQSFAYLDVFPQLYVGQSGATCSVKVDWGSPGNAISLISWTIS